MQIGLLTPYIILYDSNVAFLKDNGIDVVVQHNLGLTQDTLTSSVILAQYLVLSKRWQNLLRKT